MWLRPFGPGWTLYGIPVSRQLIVPADRERRVTHLIVRSREIVPCSIIFW